MADCIFCQIVNKEKSADIVYEDEQFIVIKDIKPLAPIHLLIVPKKHIASVNQLTPDDRQLVGDMILVAQKVARDQGIAQTGYRLGFNVGRGAGQIVDHLHLHLLGGWK